MSWFLVVPVALGAVVVLQATLNRQIASHWSLPQAALLNMCVALALSVVFLLAARARAGDAPGGADWSAVQWWWLLPGAFGFCIVVGLPWAIDRLGALTTFVALVGAQMAVGVLWDTLYTGTPLSPTRVAGAALAVVSVALVYWR